MQIEGSEQVSKDGAMAALTNFSPDTLGKMESNIRAALNGDITCISSLRCLRLYLERLGYTAKVCPSTDLYSL
jgi:pentatricopeptide repeat domain-containing protein 1